MKDPVYKQRWFFGTNCRRLALIGFLYLLPSFFLFAFSVPPMNGPVNDLAAIMTPAEKDALNAYLVNLDRQTGIQIGVLTIKSLAGESIEKIAIQTADTWKLGQADKDNGALLFVALDERKIRLEIGYGLEDSLTDVKSGLIIRDIIAPYFQAGNYGKGITAGVQTMAQIAAGENAGFADTSLPAQISKDTDISSGGGLISSMFGLVFFFIVMMSILNRRDRAVRNRSGIAGAAIAASILSSLLRSSHSNNGFSGGGGGGFSGGGGSFGGGGASGGW